MNRTEAARAMGRAKSAAKTRAAQENGRSGGRPSKELLFLRSELARIKEYLFYQCKQTCAWEKKYADGGHVPNCPVYDLDLT